MVRSLAVYLYCSVADRRQVVTARITLQERIAAVTQPNITLIAP